MSVRLWVCPIVLAGCLAATYEVTGRRLIRVEPQPDGTCVNVIEEARYYAYRDSAPTELVNVESTPVPCPRSPEAPEALAGPAPTPPSGGQPQGSQQPPPPLGDIAEIPGVMSAVEADVYRCARGNTGRAPIELSFWPDGSVGARVVDGHFRETPWGQCMELAVRSTPLPASVDRANLPRRYLLPFDLTTAAHAPPAPPADQARLERERQRAAGEGRRMRCGRAAAVWRELSGSGVILRSERDLVVVFAPHYESVVLPAMMARGREEFARTGRCPEAPGVLPIDLGYDPGYNALGRHCGVLDPAVVMAYHLFCQQADVDTVRIVPAVDRDGDGVGEELLGVDYVDSPYRRPRSLDR